ncbi:hypothetical protein N7532_009913 [Penicillium argentinense]|uniref:Uncharacterized protein n=1 Tax=Penicillium argentinense TaxID=1131581 RepID=A0A9W9JXZ0_9EURO|nr:uncharacterized protein N7532_009913 [Penicillium argentinense]KAJ5085142.1 hypothetical protein N7532_009913 [Penicillium argentinense]
MSDSWRPVLVLSLRKLGAKARGPDVEVTPGASQTDEVTAHPFLDDILIGLAYRMAWTAESSIGCVGLKPQFRILRVSCVASTMDFASLTRPSVICHCRRCFSSLAVLENEWAEVSSFYATATAWLSVDSDRISVSSQRKRIPETSDASLIRGRIAQEACCRMCPTSSKLGVLVEMDNGPIFIWKMSKVAFREVVSMRPTEPVFKQGAIEKLINPPPKEPLRSARSSIHDDALVPAGATDFRSMEPMMQQHMQHQGRSIDQISSSVNNLQDTMSDLKHSFTALRIELSGPNRYVGETGATNGTNFDMIATVLKELKIKSDEIEKLKLEIEALKLKARLAEESKPHTPDYMFGLEGALPQVQSPDLLQAGRKRGWDDTFSGRNTLTVADSFDEEDMGDDISITGEYAVNGHHIPLRELAQDRSTPRQQDPYAPPNDREWRPSNPEQSPAKRQRLTQLRKEGNQNPERRGPGRPRKSTDGTVPTSQKPQRNGESQASGSNPNSAPRPRGRPRRSVLPGSDQTTEPDSQDMQKMQEMNRSEQSPVKGTAAATTSSTGDASSTLPAGIDVPAQLKISSQNGKPTRSEVPTRPEIQKRADGGGPKGMKGDQNDTSARLKRRASIAARDAMVRNEMWREEAMETEQA